MNIDFALIVDSVPKMLDGVGITLEIFLLSTLCGTLLAIVTLLMRISPYRVLQWPAIAYIFFFRGTPMLLQIFIIYYGLAQFEFIRESFLWPVLKVSYWCAIIAFSLNAGAYTAEIFRGAVQGVDKELLEAGSALGLSKTQRFVHITTPIAVRLALPAYGNELISLMKSTALASTITIFDMMGVARTINAQTYKVYEVFISAAIVYLCIVWFIQRGIALAEWRFGRYMKR